MTLKTKIIAFLSALLASKHAAAAASGATVVAAAAVTSDWITWAISGVGAVAYRLKSQEVKQSVAIGNGIASVCVGGLGAPYAVSLVMSEGHPQPPVYLCAFLAALLWPYLWDKYILKKKDES